MAPLHRFVDRDAFTRFAGIGTGCQHFQATHILNIQVGPNYTTNTSDPQFSDGDLAELDSEANELGDEIEAN